ncbi:isoprenylcysteine carboxyl methyltransferase family protein [Brevundimonas staleyi]|uniref:Isoprenylcysteine carboxyl methyltransferase family protein n=1 Tax=Brevundimonas staleyi TaxID=74326 RepID=A0ABW0FWP6_9CAUL|nr:isoprenylcysteine carboxylmethyltransferase family protein [uncultured Brevundimonas sp.]
MMWLPIVLGLVVSQRLGELWLAHGNTKRLVAEGAVEIGAGHYPLFVILHAAWLSALAILTPWTESPNPWLLAIYVVLQFGRVWVIATLGRFWTTRIITLAGAPLVRSGPFRVIRHPNYWVASLEIAILPLVFGQVWIAVVFTALNAMLIAWRVRLEDRALADRA